MALTPQYLWSREIRPGVKSRAKELADRAVEVTDNIERAVDRAMVERWVGGPFVWQVPRGPSAEFGPTGVTIDWFVFKCIQDRYGAGWKVRYDADEKTGVRTIIFEPLDL